MAFLTNASGFERLSDQIGGAAALAFCSFFGNQGGRLYIPAQAEADHIIGKVIGLKPFSDLVAAFGGEAIHVPQLDIRPLRNAGLVYAMSKCGLSNSLMASALSLTTERVRQIQQQLRLEGLFELADELEAKNG